MSKAEHERTVLGEFSELCGLPIDPETIRSEQPPRPDISCLISGERHFFELTRLADQGIANDVGALLARAERTAQGESGPGHWYSIQDVLRAAVERKTAAKYKTSGAPLSLLMYCDGVFHALGSGVLLELAWRDAKAAYQEFWHGIWLYDRNNKHLYD